MIYLWYNGMQQATFAKYGGKKVKLNVTKCVSEYINELCKDVPTNGLGATMFPYTQQVWDKLLCYGVVCE